uniref:Uncharacterized protein n=1 Tax=Myripristis murdjan TaxID=586833 RepID=A0A667WHE7_9TELE
MNHAILERGGDQCYNFSNFLSFFPFILFLCSPLCNYTSCLEPGDLSSLSISLRALCYLCLPPSYL